MDEISQLVSSQESEDRSFDDDVESFPGNDSQDELSTSAYENEEFVKTSIKMETEIRQVTEVDATERIENFESEILKIRQKIRDLGTDQKISNGDAVKADLENGHRATRRRIEMTNNADEKEDKQPLTNGKKVVEDEKNVKMSASNKCTVTSRNTNGEKSETSSTNETDCSRNKFKYLQTEGLFLGVLF